MAQKPMPKIPLLDLPSFLGGVERFQWIENDVLFDYDRAGAKFMPSHYWFMRSHPTEDYYWDEDTSNATLFPKLFAVLNAGIYVSYLARRL